MSDKIRTFIAIELTPEVQSKLAKIQAKLKESGADVKWVKVENIHLTLRFLGNVSIEQIDRIKGAIEEIARKIKPFSITLANLGAFPRLENPRVIWVGVEEGEEQLTALSQILDEQLERLDFSTEARPFHPHVTLGRLKSPLNRSKLIELLNLLRPPEPLFLKLNKITLFQSILKPEGPLYNRLYEVSFRVND